MIRTNDLVKLSKTELQDLIDRAESRLSEMDQSPDIARLMDDDRITALCNELLLTAHKTSTPKDDVFRAVAGALRISLQEVAEVLRNAGVETEEKASVSSDTPIVESAAAGAATAPEPLTTEAAPPSTPTRLTLHLRQRQSHESVQRAHSKTTPGSTRARPLALHRKEGGAQHSNSTETKHAGQSADVRDIVYAHPVDRNKSWNGHGAMPKWLRDALSFGRTLEEFRVSVNH